MLQQVKHAQRHLEPNFTQWTLESYECCASEKGGGAEVCLDGEEGGSGEDGKRGDRNTATCCF